MKYLYLRHSISKNLVIYTKFSDKPSLCCYTDTNYERLIMINIVLVEPEIPQNAGNIVRTSAAIGANLYMVKPLGFEMSEKHFKRAGLDYFQRDPCQGNDQA